MTFRLLLLHLPSSPEVAGILRKVFPDAAISESEELNEWNIPGEFDLMVIRGDNNAAMARVRLLRKRWPHGGIVVVAERDRSSAAYMAGANAFAFSNDSDQLAHELREIAADFRAVAGSVAT